MKTKMFTHRDISAKWYLVDAKDKVLGRLVSRVALILRGKNRPEFSPNADTGDFVIIVNADKVRLTGRKWQNKKYYHFSGYPGGLRQQTAKELRNRYPERIIKHAVKGMLPKNRLGQRLAKKIKVYAGPDHPHQAQKPVKLDI